MLNSYDITFNSTLHLLLILFPNAVLQRARLFAIRCKSIVRQILESIIHFLVAAFNWFSISLIFSVFFSFVSLISTNV